MRMSSKVLMPGHMHPVQPREEWDAKTRDKRKNDADSIAQVSIFLFLLAPLSYSNNGR